MDVSEVQGCGGVRMYALESPRNWLSGIFWALFGAGGKLVSRKIRNRRDCPALVAHP